MVWNGIVTMWLLIAAVIYMCWLVYSHLDRRLNLLHSDLPKVLAVEAFEG